MSIGKIILWLNVGLFSLLLCMGFLGSYLERRKQKRYREDLQKAGITDE